MGLMNERATDQMGCAHPWPVRVDPSMCVSACVGERERKRHPHALTQKRADYLDITNLFVCLRKFTF